MNVTPQEFAAGDKRLAGFSVDVANNVFGTQLGWEYEFHEYPSYSTLLYATRIGRCDIGMGPFFMSEAREQCTSPCKMYNASAPPDDPEQTSTHAEAGCCIDYTLPFSRSGIAIMKRVQVISVTGALGKALTKPFILTCLCVLVIGIVLVGAVVFFYEHWLMTGAFHDHWQDGLQECVWLALVTTTTVGYGDYAPRSGGGRGCIAVWMWVGFIALAGVLGEIVDTLGSVAVDETHANIDFPGMKGTTICVYPPYIDGILPYGMRNVPVEGEEDPAKCIERLKSGEVDAVAYDKPVLQAYREEDPDLADCAIGDLYKQFDLAATFAENSPLADPLKIAMIRVLDNQAWLDTALATHFGDGSPPEAFKAAPFPTVLVAMTVTTLVIFAAAQMWPISVKNRQPDKVRRRSTSAIDAVDVDVADGGHGLVGQNKVGPTETPTSHMHALPPIRRSSAASLPPIELSAAASFVTVHQA